VEFSFVLTKYDGVAFRAQIGKALEKRTELLSREKYPNLWRCVDKLNSKRAPEEVLGNRRGRYRVYGILLLLLGLFVLIPSLMKPKQMLIPLLVGSIAVVRGASYLRKGNKSSNAKLTAFDKAAMELFKKYEKIPPDQVTIVFNDDKVLLPEDVEINYSDIERFLITEDFFILVWNEKITVLQKADLSSGNVDEFIRFIIHKSNNSFEVVNINS